MGKTKFGGCKVKVKVRYSC